MTFNTGRVFIIGAGPGDPGLITARGLRLLGQADVVVYDTAVEAVLRWARPDAERIAVGAPAERDVAQAAISMLLAEKAREGQRRRTTQVGRPVRIRQRRQGSDVPARAAHPVRGGARRAAAIGSSAYAGIPVTYPGAGDTLVLLRGQENSSDEPPNVNWNAIASLDGTFACYLNGAAVPSVLQRLDRRGHVTRHAGRARPTGHAARRSTRPAAPIASLLAATTDGDAGPGLLVVGKVAGLRDHLRWFDERPLFGRRIVVTRSPEQAPGTRRGARSAWRASHPRAHRSASSLPKTRKRSTARLRPSTSTTGWSSNRPARPRDFSRPSPGARATCAHWDACPSARSGPRRPTASPRLGSDRTWSTAEAGPSRLSDALSTVMALEGRRVLVVRPDLLHDVVGPDLEQSGASVTDLVAYRTEPVHPTRRAPKRSTVNYSMARSTRSRSRAPRRCVDFR